MGSCKPPSVLWIGPGRVGPSDPEGRESGGGEFSFTRGMIVGPKAASSWGSEAKQSLLTFGEVMRAGKDFIESVGKRGERGQAKQTSAKESDKAGGNSEGTTAMVVWTEGPPSCWGASGLGQHTFRWGSDVRGGT